MLQPESRIIKEQVYKTKREKFPEHQKISIGKRTASL